VHACAGQWEVFNPGKDNQMKNVAWVYTIGNMRASKPYWMDRPVTRTEFLAELRRVMGVKRLPRGTDAWAVY